MTQDQFLEFLRHEWAGMVLDGATNAKTGADLAIWMRQIMRKIDAKLIEAYTRMKEPAAKPVPNGQPVTTQKVKP